MYRRRFLIALAVMVPLAIFGLIKWVTWWRPVRLTRLHDPMSIAGNVPYGITVSEALVNVNNETYNLKTGALAEKFGFIAGFDTWAYWIDESSSDRTSLVLFTQEEPDKKLFYDFPPTDNFLNYGDMTVRFAPATDRLEVTLNGTYTLWSVRSRHLERRVRFVDAEAQPNSFGQTTALSRDGKTVVYAGVKMILIASTRTGQVLSRVAMRPLNAKYLDQNIFISPFGSHALYEPAAIAPSKVRTLTVRQTRTGRANWSFTLPPTSPVNSGDWQAAFSSDDTEIAVPVPADHIWQIRDLESGEIVRKLPLVPGAKAGAFSPTGATLYSVANGVLYRQRAR